METMTKLATPMKQMKRALKAARAPGKGLHGLQARRGRKSTK